MKLDSKLIENLQDINWAYSWYDSSLDEIISNIYTLKKEYKVSDPSKYKIFDEYNDVLNFKIKEVYDTLMRMHLLLSETTVGFYKKYHGPFREELGEGGFEEVKREITYSLESFLTQLKSLIDISIKFAFNLSIVNNPTNEDEIDSLGILDRAYRKIGRFHNSWNIIKKSHFFSGYITNSSALFEAQNYRDHIVHESYLKLQVSPILNNGEIFFRYKMPKISGKKKSRKLSNTEYIDIIQFSREKFYLVLSILLKLTQLMFDSSIKKNHLRELLRLSHQDVSRLLCKISLQGKLAEKSFLSKEELDEYLLKQKIDPNELVEYKKREHGNKSKFSDRTDKTEIIDYVPMKGLGVYKIRTSYGTPTDLKIGEWHYGVMKVEAAKEDYSKIQNSEKILEHLQGCGLIYASKPNQQSFGPLKDDLKNLIHHLLNINQSKWSVQLDMNRYTEQIPEVEEWLKKSHGKKYARIKKKQEDEIKSQMVEYRKWQKNPYYNSPPLILRDTQKTIINKISYQDFKEEEQRRFSNWHNNVLIRAGSGTRENLVPIGIFDSQKILGLITTCQKGWKKKPYNDIDWTKKRIKKDRIRYILDVKETKTDYKNTIHRYASLKSILRLINNDVYSDQVDFKKVNPGLFASR